MYLGSEVMVRKLESSYPFIFFPDDIQPIEIGNPINGTGATNVRGIRYGDSGIIQEKEDGDACLAAASSYYVGKASDYVDRATDLVASLLCTANVQGQDTLRYGGARPRYGEGERLLHQDWHPGRHPDWHGDECLPG